MMAEQERQGPERNQTPPEPQATADDSFLQSLGLREHPFAQRFGTIYVYFDHERSEALVRMTEALLQGASLCLVVGPPGAGKTAFLSKLAARILSVSAAKVLTGAAATGSPMQRILAAGPSFEDSEDPASGDFATGGVIAPPVSAPVTSVLFVDDADTLSTAAWQRFRSWRERYVDRQGPLGVVMSAVDADHVGEHWAEGRLPDDAEVIELAPFGFESSKALIGHRVEKAGGRVDAVFSGEAVERICEIACGNPGLIVELCHRSMGRAAPDGAAPIPSDVIGQVAEESTDLVTRIAATKSALAERTPEPTAPLETAGPTGSEAIEVFDVGTLAASAVPDAEVIANTRSRNPRTSFARFAGYATMLAVLAVLAAGGLFAANAYHPLWDSSSEPGVVATSDDRSDGHSSAPPGAAPDSGSGQERVAAASIGEAAAVVPEPSPVRGTSDADPAELAEMSTASGSDAAAEIQTPGDPANEESAASQPSASGGAGGSVPHPEPSSPEPASGVPPPETAADPGGDQSVAVDSGDDRMPEPAIADAVEPVEQTSDPAARGDLEPAAASRPVEPAGRAVRKDAPRRR